MNSDDTANKVFVGGLPAQTNDESLWQYFTQYGATDCKVMMDRVTGRSRGFGFVTLSSPEMVTLALATSHIIDGKVAECRPCMSKTQWASDWQGQSTALVPSDGSGAWGSARPLECKIFVGGLAPTTTTDSMNAYFSQFGSADCIVMMDRTTGRSRGFGFCTFETEEQVQLVFAMGTTKGNAVEHIIDGKVVSVKRCEAKGEYWQTSYAPQTSFAPRVQPQVSGAGSELETLQQSLGTLVAALGLQQSQPSSSTEPAVSGGGRFAQSRVFVGGLPQSCDDAKLHTFFSQFGTLTDAKVMMDRNTGRSRGFGYVSFAEPVAMEAALANGHANVIDDKWIEVKRCEEKAAAPFPTFAPTRPRGGAPPIQGTLSNFGPRGAPPSAASGGMDLAATAAQLAAALQCLGQEQSPNILQQAPSAAPLQLALTQPAPMQPQVPQLSASSDGLADLAKLLQDPAALLTTILTPVVQQLTQVRSSPY